MDPARGAVFKQHLVNGMYHTGGLSGASESSLWGWVTASWVTGAAQLGEDSSLCLLAGYLQFGSRLALAPGQALASFWT